MGSGDAGATTAGSVSRDTLVAGANELLRIDAFKDYGPNGLQVEGRPLVRKLVSGVTASLGLIDAAIAEGADALLVHHGLFWRGQDGRLTGWLAQRVSRLMKHDISLLAYHLPLDAHESLGNNAQLGLKLGVKADARFGDKELGFIGEVAATTARELADHAARVLGRGVNLVEGDGRPIRRLAWCSGGAQDWFEEAIAAGADAFITGEMSEPQPHLARETGVAFLACGHHATERYGAPAVAAHLAERFGIAHRFIDIDSPA